MPRQNSINAPTLFQVSKGGTGRTSLDQYRLLQGDGTNPVVSPAIGNAGEVFIQGVGFAPPPIQELNYNNLIYVQDQKTQVQNSSAGTFTSGAWRTRELNTVLVNNIAGASLASNQITLPSGTYYCMGSAPGRKINLSASLNSHQSKLYNVTGSSDLFIGSLDRYYGTAGLNISYVTRTLLEGTFTIGSSSAVEFQHRCLSSARFGIAAGFSVIEVYAEIAIWKVA